MEACVNVDVDDVCNDDYDYDYDFFLQLYMTIEVFLSFSKVLKKGCMCQIYFY